MLDVYASGGETTALDLLDSLAPTWDDDPLWDRVTAYIDGLPPDALTRIVEARHWRAGVPDSPLDPCRCLTWHAADMRCTGYLPHGRGTTWAPHSDVPESLQAGLDWDALVEDWGLARCVARCQQIAADRLDALVMAAAPYSTPEEDGRR